MSLERERRSILEERCPSQVVLKISKRHVCDLKLKLLREEASELGNKGLGLCVTKAYCLCVH